MWFVRIIDTKNGKKEEYGPRFHLLGDTLGRISKETYPLILEDEEFVSILFGDNRYAWYGNDLIANEIENNHLSVVNKLFRLVYDNRSNLDDDTVGVDDPFAAVLLYTSESIYEDELDDDMVDLLMFWIEKISSEEDRAKVIVEYSQFL